MVAMFIFLVVYVAVVAHLVYRGRDGFEIQSYLPLHEGDPNER